MTIPGEFNYFEAILPGIECTTGAACDAWEAARSQYLSGDIDFEAYLTAFRLYVATCTESAMLHLRLEHAQSCFEKGETLEVRQEMDGKAQRTTVRYWRTRAGA